MDQAEMIKNVQPKTFFPFLPAFCVVYCCGFIYRTHCGEWEFIDKAFSAALFRIGYGGGGGTLGNRHDLDQRYRH